MMIISLRAARGRGWPGGPCVARGVCMATGCARQGHAWPGACPGDAWQGGMHGRGMHAWGHVWQGACMTVGACMAGEKTL